jgi:hypothetical protein
MIESMDEELDSLAMDRPFEREFREDQTDLPGDRLLYRSTNFTVRGSYETVFVEGRHLSQAVSVGDHYGYPSAAAINRTERWCVSVSEGLIAYRLEAPWREYEGSSDEFPDQWWEYGRDPMIGITRVRPNGDNAFLFTMGPDSDWIVSDWRVDPDAADVRLAQQWVDEAHRYRTNVMTALVGLPISHATVDRNGLTLKFVSTDEAMVRISGHLSTVDPLRSAVHWSSRAFEPDPYAGVTIRDELDWTVTEVDAWQNGQLTIRVQANAMLPERCVRDIHTHLDQPAGSWLVANVVGSVTCPGPDGWPEEPPSNL